MEVKHYQDQDGNWYRELIEKSVAPLHALREDYKARGHKTWLNPYDATKWMLTVCTGKERA